MNEKEPDTEHGAIWDQFEPEENWQPPVEHRGIRLALGGLLFLGIVASAGWWAWRTGSLVVVSEPAAGVLAEDEPIPVSTDLAALEAKLIAAALPVEPEMPWLVGKSYLQPGETAFAGNFQKRHALPAQQSQPGLLMLAEKLNRPETWLYLGELELATGNYQQAQAAFENAVALDPTAVHALSGLVRVLLATNQLTAAEDPVATLALQFPAHPGAAYVRALHARQSGDFERALSALTVILNREPDHPLGTLLLGDVQLARGNPERALVNLNRYHRLDPDSMLGTNLLARAYLGMQQPEQAEQLLLPLMDRMQQFPAIASNLADSYSLMGKTVQAQAYRSLYQKLGAGQAATLGVLEYLDIARSQAIFAEVGDSVNAPPDKLASRTLSTISQLRRGQPEVVAAVLGALQMRLPHASRRQYLFGRLAELRGDSVSAVAHYRYALLLDADFPATEHALMRLQGGESNLPGIVKRLENARAENNAALKPRLLLADIYLRQREFERALEVSREIEALAPQYAPGNYMLAAATIQSGDIRGGVALMQLLEPGHSDSLPLQWRLVEAYEWLGDWQAVRDTLERVLVKDDQNPRALAKLALLEQYEGNTAAVHALAERLVRQHPQLTTGYLIESQLALAVASLARGTVFRSNLDELLPIAQK